MYIKRTDALKILEGTKNHLLDSLSKNADFLAGIVEGDDWSFVIKAHALIEAAVTGLLTTVLGDDRIRDVLERLPLSDSQAGKITIAKQLGVLTAEQIKFIRKFSELRNQLVHKVDNVGFTFDDFWSKLDGNQKSSWVETISWSLNPDGKESSFTDLIRDYPRIGLQISIFQLVSICQLTATEAATLREITKQSELDTSGYVDLQSLMISEQAELIAKQREFLDELMAESAQDN
jgi:DNA-binding MltR family transcriptional regulator